MKKFAIAFALMVFGLFVVTSCKKEVKKPSEIENKNNFDSGLIAPFFTKHPELKSFQPQVEKLYQKHNYHYLWYDKGGINELGDLLYGKISNLENEGVPAKVPYIAELDGAIDNAEKHSRPDTETELLVSSLYFFYADKVYHGIDAEQSQEVGWYLPRKKVSYVNYLDSLLIKPSLMNKDEKEVLGQYYKLRTVLEKYRAIEKKGGWKNIEMDAKSFKPGDSSQAITQIRERLAIMGDLKTDSKSSTYDDELAEGVMNFKKRMGETSDKKITKKLVESLNVPIAARIRTITVNMERCRWISADIAKSDEYIFINIPSYRLNYIKGGKPILTSDVVVGKEGHNTVVFSGLMKYIVFSPYWNIPKSIVEKEIKPGLAKDKNYLAHHDMERNGNQFRQKPGLKNSLGLVKFLFPNSNNIYLHDTPAKELFNKDNRAFSHGCIRVQKAKDLAGLILKDDKDWPVEKIDAAMNAGKEKWVTLKKKIPVYIGYFTAWVDADGAVHFYDDVYNRDERLGEMVFEQ